MVQRQYWKDCQELADDAQYNAQEKHAHFKESRCTHRLSSLYNRFFLYTCFLLIRRKHATAPATIIVGISQYKNCNE